MNYIFPERENAQTISREGNNISELTLTFNKSKVQSILKTVLALGLIIGYVTVTILSYSISPVYFWILIKAGVILSLLAIIRLNK